MLWKNLALFGLRRVDVSHYDFGPQCITKSYSQKENIASGTRGISVFFGAAPDDRTCQPSPV